MFFQLKSAIRIIAQCVGCVHNVSKRAVKRGRACVCCAECEVSSNVVAVSVAACIQFKLFVGNKC